ncbi:MAG: DUF1272 domain-containing protein [Phycisphaerales bacterium JB043]
MRERCERCGRATPGDGEAWICSYECTFCGECATEMERVCPNCSGELVRRPVRAGWVETGAQDDADGATNP